MALATKGSRFATIFARMAMVQSEARIIVALHIGSDWSTFAYACTLNPIDIHVCDNWPNYWRHGMKQTLKTLSAIYYEPGDAATAKVKSWGYTALTDHESAVKLKRQRPSEVSEAGTYFRSFEIARELSTALLQKGFTITQVISDYLREMGALIMSELQHKYGRHVSMNDVEWCVALAHDWGDHGKKLMKTSMERAGLVQSAISRGGSPYPLRFVPELDAASYACLQQAGGSRIQVGDKLLVAELGYKSCRVSVQEVHSVERSKFEVKQVAESVGDLGGRQQWNEMFMELLMAKMLPVQDNALKVYAFKQFLELHFMDPGAGLRFTDFKRYKTGYTYVLPINAQNRWKELDVEHGNKIRDSYDVIEVSEDEFRTAIKPYLDKCIDLLVTELMSTPEVKAILFGGELCNLLTFSIQIFKYLNCSVKVVTDVISAASTGAVAMVLDQMVLQFTWKGGGKLLKDGATASSSHGDGITGQTSSPEIYEVLLGGGSTSPSLESSNALGGGEGFEPSLESKPSNSKVEGLVKKYSWDQVLQMTNGLTSRMLGKRGFGMVYLGKFENGKEVAVKVLNQCSQEDKLETFVHEVNLLIQVNHVNLVKLLGYCQDERNVVIYEYAEEGSIGDHLHGDKTRLNDWKQRLSIMLQAAYGLDYLHSQCSPTIIHRDIKSENILLTKNMVAKVADFGISKLMGVDDVDMNTHLTTKVIGSLWYIDPEYQETGQLRQSSDVYSFGIVLLEMVSGRKPSGIGAWVIKLYGSGGGRAIKAITNPSLSGNYNRKAMKVVIELAISCIDTNGTSRPMMGEVVGELKKTVN